MLSKKIISGVVTFGLVLSLISVMFIETPVKAEAATGRWVLQTSKTEYGNSEYYGDVWKFDHEEKDGQIIYKITRTFSNVDGTFTGLYTTKSDIPPASIGGDQTVSLNVSASVQGGMDNLLCSNNVYHYFCSVDSDGSVGYGRDFTKKSTGSTSGSSVSVWTGPASNRQYSDQDVVYYKFPEGDKDGERMCIQLQITTGTMSNGKNNGGLITNWFYVWRVDKELNTPTKAKISKLAAGKKKLTVTAKKIASNCSGYEYQVSTNKKFPQKATISVTSAKSKITIKGLKKGRKYYVRVRGYNMDPNNSESIKYGKWSAIKNKKTK